MRILLDEALPRRSRGELPGHNTSTVTECGWSGLDNGALLRTAAGEFDVFFTADQNLEYQQNLSALPPSRAGLAVYLSDWYSSVDSADRSFVARLSDVLGHTLAT